GWPRDEPRQATAHPSARRPRAGRRGRRHRPALRLELHAAARALRRVLGPVGGLPGDPRLRGAVAADARRGLSRGARRLLRAATVALGIAWALPYTVPGLAAGLAALPFGARMRLRTRELALVFDAVPFGPGGALTLGNVVLHTGDSIDSDCLTYAHRAGLCVQPAVRLVDHERAHVLQYMALGPLFLPLYFLCGGISVRNRFERAADRYALTGRGWWPWPAPPTDGRLH